MSVRFLNDNSSNNTDVVAKTFPSVTPPVIIPWVRNPSWPACVANSGDNRVRGLYAVWPSGANFIAMTVSGAYTVNYGDGTTTNYTSGTQANYEYSYADADLVGTEAPVTFTDTGDTVNRTAHGYTDGMQVQFFNITTTTGIVNAQFYFVINATANTFQVSATLGGSALALTNDGTGQLLPYRVATVTITPQGGSNLTSVNLSVKHNQSGLQAYSTGWLELAVATPNITSFNLGQGSTTTTTNYLQSLKINQAGAISFSSFCRNLVVLENFEVASTIASSSVSNMFNGCFKLQTVPLFNTVNATDFSNMFLNCRNLKQVPLFNTANVTAMASMFNGCVSLQTVPLFNTIKVTSMNGMFTSSGIITVPLFNTVALTNMNDVFSSCSSLVSVPLFNTASVTSSGNTFSGCSSLQTVPLFNTTNVTAMSNMFNGCTRLQTVPLFNTENVTTMASMFNGCSSLVTVPLFNTIKVTSMSNMFENCRSLQTVPLFNTVAATGINSMFSGCISLQTVPLFNTALVTNASRMFDGCTSLVTVPLFNFVVNTNATQMFGTCSSLQSIPAFITTAVTSGNFNNMFNTCPSLSRIEAKDFRFSFSVASCKLSATALNEIYTNLPTAVGQTITVSSNYGVTGDDPTIATLKGWTVSG